MPQRYYELDQEDQEDHAEERVEQKQEEAEAAVRQKKKHQQGDTRLGQQKSEEVEQDWAGIRPREEWQAQTL